MRRSPFILVLGAVGTLMCRVPAADAGCGCEKAPPAVAAVRPAFASPGDEVSIFAAGLVEGAAYTVAFGGLGGAEVPATAIVRRDLADGVAKAQLVVAAPALPPGPTQLSVTAVAGGAVLLDVASSDFTMLQAAVELGNRNGKTIARCYRAAVGADGVAYFPLDISGIVDRMIFSGVGKGGFPLHFGAEDIVIYNTQGVLMQLLGPDAAGIYSIEDVDDESPPNAEEQGPSSFRLTYDRHEFQTYQTLHTTDPNYLLDPLDPNWHVDGTRHVDHYHLVVAITGIFKGGTVPEAPSAGPFVLRLATTVADDPNGHVAVTRIDWSDDCGPAPVDGTTTTTTLPPGDGTCATCDDAAGLCGDATIAACDGVTIPAAVGRSLVKGCRLLERADGAAGRRRRRLVTKLGRMLDRTESWLGRPAATREMSATCLEAIAAAVDDLRGGMAGVP